MALVTDKDGKETVGGIVSIRNAFVEASDRKLVCLDSKMEYDHSSGANGQKLTFSGRWADDGTPFITTVTAPPGLALAPYARMAARELIEKGKG